MTLSNHDERIQAEADIWLANWARSRARMGMAYPRLRWYQRLWLRVRQAWFTVRGVE